MGSSIRSLCVCFINLRKYVHVMVADKLILVFSALLIRQQPPCQIQPEEDCKRIVTRSRQKS